MYYQGPSFSLSYIEKVDLTKLERKLMNIKEDRDEFEVSLDELEIVIRNLSAIYNPDISNLLEQLKHTLAELKSIPMDREYWDNL